MTRISIGAFHGLLCSVLFLGSTVYAEVASALQIEPVDLTCEYRENPLGIDAGMPRLAWRIEERSQKPEVRSQRSEDGGRKSEVRGLKQTAYQVLVASTEELLKKDQGDLWDSGKVEAGQASSALYDGKPLEPRQRCYWKVRVWTLTSDNRPLTSSTSAWSQSAEWTMGAGGDWRGAWIAARDVPMNRPVGQSYIRAPGENSTGHVFDDEPGIGYHAVIAANGTTEKWVQVDLGQTVPIQRVRLQTLDHDDVKGFGFPLRYRLEASDDAAFSQPRLLEDRTGDDVANPGATWLKVEGNGVRGRYVRLTATKLFARPANPQEFCFGLRTLEVISGDTNVAFKAPVEALDSVEAHGWSKNHLVVNGSKPTSRHEAVLLRREVAIAGKPIRALARVTALGFVEFMVNGTRVGDRAMAPGLSDLTKRVYYDTYDVTRLLKAGNNTFAAILGNGYYSCPGRGYAKWYGVGKEPVLSAEVELIMADGSRQILGTDTQWTWSTGAITFNDFFTGEKQDLRLAQPGWNLSGFDAGRWQAVVPVLAPPGRLQANPGVPVRSCKVIKPLRVEGDRYIFDSMYVGWPRIEVQGQPGQVVEVVQEGDFARYKFILKGGGVEVLEPKFVVHSIGPAFSIKGITPPPAEAVSIQWVRADLRMTSSFDSSNAFLNRVHAALLRTHLNYLFDFPADPTREKTGWTQDVQSMIDTTVYLSDMSPLYRRWWVDFQDSQTPDGAAGSCVPMIWGGQEHCWDDPWWSGMIIYTPWQHYLYYGDRQFLASSYESMKAYLAWLSNQADKNDGLMRWAGASDWIEVGIDGWGPPKRTPTLVVSTAAWYLYADILSKTARILGKSEDATAYEQQAKQIKDNFNAKCFDPDTGLYAKATDSQTALILPLCLDMVPECKQSLVVKRLEENIHQWNGHLSTGFVGTPYLLEGLSRFGLADLSYTIVNQQDYAGWNTLITEGVMKETWRGGMAQMPSLGGSIGQWYYKVAAGIRPDPDGPGFRKIIIKPSIMGDLTWVKAHFDSPQGRIVSNWTREGEQLTMNVTIPANATATVHVPAKDAARVTEGGKAIGQAEGVKLLRMENGAAVFEVGSGCYVFVSTVGSVAKEKE